MMASIRVKLDDSLGYLKFVILMCHRLNVVEALHSTTLQGAYIILMLGPTIPYLGEVCDFL